MTENLILALRQYHDTAKRHHGHLTFESILVRYPSLEMIILPPFEEFEYDESELN